MQAAVVALLMCGAVCAGHAEVIETSTTNSGGDRSNTVSDAF